MAIILLLVLQERNTLELVEVNMVVPIFSIEVMGLGRNKRNYMLVIPLAVLDLEML